MLTSEKFPYLWEKFSSAICNLDEEEYFLSGKVHETTLSEAQKLSMILQVIPSDCEHEDHFLFRPTHVIYGESCMLISAQAFDISSSGPPQKIDDALYDADNRKHYQVCHIKFGPRSSPGKRQASIWFDIPHEKIHQVGVCQPVKASESPQTTAVVDLDPLPARRSFSDDASHLQKPFLLKLLPHDPEYFQLAMDVLNLRLKSLSLEVSWEDAALEGEKLQGTFQSLLRNWQTMSSWPVNLGREIVNSKTKLPSVSSEYKIPEKEGDASETHSSRVWDAFLSQVGAKSKTKSKSSRLPVFQAFSEKSYEALKHTPKQIG